ncbi:hypothetical protein [Nocardioides donggukensis]|uniref:Uncharacterized protein n=1 Tax=Nocardioides donggukensis TaxID=2774019 RepID=A0A927Q1X8_9ACTN|nr:hypothetical protein [Nocardioides donggukensis]MBD8869146.1 hypothetical protein [Nocardioides donggukensis]
MAVLAVVLTLVLVRDGEPDRPADQAGPTGEPQVTQPRPDLATRLLADLETAVADGDGEAAAALADPDDADAVDRARAIAENGRRLRVDDFTLRYVDDDPGAGAGLPQGQWAAAVEATWRFAGADPEPARAEVTVTFSGDDDGESEEAGLVAVGGGDRRTPLWLAEPVVVRRSPGTLVLVAEGPGRVDDYDRYARRAVRTVRRVLPGWQETLVVEVPRTAEALDAALDVEPGEYASIAAVTATVDGSVDPGAPVHVFVNPEVLGNLREQGAQVVMSHEAAHVASGAATARTPLWLLEGFADYVALRDVDLPLSVTAGQVAAQVRDEGAPEALPGKDEFDTRTTHLGAAYEAAWLACRVLAEAAGEQALVEINRRAARGDDVDRLLREVAGLDEAELTRRWRRELIGIARGQVA